jgi:hypothetical protein
MAATASAPLIGHSHVTPWGFLVALPLAAAFGLMGLRAIAATSLLPQRLGVFVEPPPWIVGLAFLVFALFLFLVGVSEFVRFLRPSVEVVVDRDGIATFGLLGERRVGWGDILWSEFGQDTLSLKVRQKGRVPVPDMRIHFSRLDVEPVDVLAAIRVHRPDLAARS